MMEYWLSFNNNAERLQLPVNPQEFQLTQGNTNTVVNVYNIGEINLIGKGRLAEITLESFFPAQEYTFCAYTGFPRPYECVAMIERWRQSGKPIRLIITETPINLACAIESFSYKEQDGTGDVYFTLELKEYRFVNVKTTNITTAATTKREVSKTMPKTYVVKAGDTLWEIAKRFTGNGANYKAIAAKNNIKDPNKIYPGQKLVLP